MNTDDLIRFRQIAADVTSKLVSNLIPFSIKIPRKKFDSIPHPSFVPELYDSDNPVVVDIVNDDCLNGKQVVVGRVFEIEYIIDIYDVINLLSFGIIEKTND